jgi:hypothetical protein
MNAPEIPLAHAPAFQGETLIRNLLRSLSKAQRMDILAATGWKDDSSISQVINGGSGIKLEHLDAILRILGLSIQEDWYMDYLGRGNAIGANCCRARASMGICRAR